MYKRILVPLDGSELGARALPVAERLCDVWDIELVVATFLTGDDDSEHRSEIVARQTTPLRHRPRTVVRPIVSSVGDEIADELHDHPDTLVVMATRAHSRLGPILGSVAEDVLHWTRSPTVLVGPRASISPAWPTGPMLVCTDRSELADSIVPVAASWQQELGLHPWLIQVGSPDGLPRGVDPGLEMRGVRAMAEELSGLSGQPADYDVLHGEDPAEAIVDHARLEDAGLIAVATHGATGLRRFALGSVSMAVVHDAPCPVLVIKP